MRLAVLTILTCSFTFFGCKSRTDESSNNGSSAKSVEDIKSMQSVPGTDKFVVVCNYHAAGDQPEIVTANDIRNNNVCRAGAVGPGGIAGACSYANGVFSVMHNNQVYQTSVQNYPQYTIACGAAGSAMYDGNSLHVFSNALLSFQTVAVDQGVPRSDLFVVNATIFFVGSKNLVSYEIKTAARRNQDITLYPNFKPLRDVTPRTLMVYDGDRVYSFCNGAWKVWNAANGQPFHQVSWRGEKRFITILDHEFTIDPDTCSFSSSIPRKRTEPAGTMPACKGANSYGNFADGGGCNSYGCFGRGGNCNSYGCYREKGNCNSYGCAHANGECNSYGCWEDGGGCNTYGCWRIGGTCSSNGCVNGMESFPALGAAFSCGS